jgi:hypothetical protein
VWLGCCALTPRCHTCLPPPPSLPPLLRILVDHVTVLPPLSLSYVCAANQRSGSALCLVTPGLPSLISSVDPC